GHEWWAFEGFSHVDCCLITDKMVLLVEGKRTEHVSDAISWRSRNQLWRNVEVAHQFAHGKEFGVLVAVEEEQHGRDALAEADRNLAASYPHLSAWERAALSKHLLGFVTWPQIVEHFGLPREKCLPNTTDDIV